MSAIPSKLTEWLKADCGFDEVAARKLLAAHDAGRYDEAAGFLMDAFCWSAAPWPPAKPGRYWGAVEIDFRAATPESRCDAMNVIRLWLGETTTSQLVLTKPIQSHAAPSEPTEDQVATWLAARGMTMIDTKELAALKRNGIGGPPPIDGETLRRISRY